MQTSIYIAPRQKFLGKWPYHRFLVKIAMAMTLSKSTPYHYSSIFLSKSLLFSSLILLQFPLHLFLNSLPKYKMLGTHLVATLYLRYGIFLWISLISLFHMITDVFISCSSRFFGLALLPTQTTLFELHSHSSSLEGAPTPGSSPKKSCIYKIIFDRNMSSPQ